MDVNAEFAKIVTQHIRDTAPVSTHTYQRNDIFKTEKGDAPPMPIKGLTDRNTLKPQLPRLGKLRKGGPKPVKGPGEDLDHFRFTSDNPEVTEAFHKIYGQKPRVINIVLWYPTYEETFSSWVECWDATGLIFRSDGETCVLWRDGDQMKTGSKPHVDDPDQQEVGRFEMILPDLWDAGFRGTVTLETHGNHDLRNIGGVILAAEQGRDTLRGLHLVLYRVQEEVSAPGFGERKGKRTKVKKWLVKLKPPRDLFPIDAPAETPQLNASTPDAEWDEGTFEAGEDDEPKPTEAMPRPQEPAHTEGAGPTQAKAKRPSAAALSRWDKLWGAAQALGLFVKPIAGDANTAEVAKRGKELREQIAQHEADLAAEKD